MRVLFIPMDGQGHLSASLAIAEFFKQAGHEISFIIRTNWQSLFKPFGYNYHLFSNFSDENEDHQKESGDFFYINCKYFRGDQQSQKLELYREAKPVFSNFIQSINDSIVTIINSFKPDIIFYDFFLGVPAIILSGIPRVSIQSSNPKFLYQVVKPTPEEIEIVKSVELQNEDHKKWLIEKGVDEATANMQSFSPFLNVYIYPEDLDYLERGPLPDTFYRVDCGVRNEDSVELNVDLSFVKPGDKLIYFSLGSMCGADLELMEKMLAIFAKSKHKFVISKGPFPERIKLRSNMVGVKFVSQVKLFPHVDLAILHGGNNSFIEALYFAKPAIILPLFGDQLDNGERIAEKNLGKCFNPFKVTEEEMLNAIDTLLNDRELHKRLKELSDKMKSSKSGPNLVQLCEQLALGKKA